MKRLPDITVADLRETARYNTIKKCLVKWMQADDTEHRLGETEIYMITPQVMRRAVRRR